MATSGRSYEQSYPSHAALQDLYGQQGPAVSAADAALWNPGLAYPSGANHMLGAGISGMPDDQTKRDKDAILTHPLYPLLMLLFEKCELATCTPRDGGREGAGPVGADACSADGVKADIEQYAKQLRQDKQFYSSNPEVDTLMVQALQVLQYHLIEIEKVHALCDSFTQRYISCLKGKMPTDLIVDDRSGAASSSSAGGNDPFGPPPTTPTPEPHGGKPTKRPKTESSPTTPLSGGHDASAYYGYEPQQALEANNRISCHSDQGNGPPPQSLPLPPPPVGQGAPTYHDLTPPSSSTLNSNANNNNPIASPAMTDSSSLRAGSGEPPVTPHNIQHHHTSLTDSISEAGDFPESPQSFAGEGAESGSSGGKRKLSNVFPKEAVNKMRAFLFQNLKHPYPSEDQKKQLAQDTGLTILQVNNWFINARRRIVQPMIDQSNRAGRSPVVNVFKNRRRKSSGQSPGPSPGPTQYSPENGGMMANYNHASDLYRNSMFSHNPYAAAAHTHLGGGGLPGQMLLPHANPHAAMMMAHHAAASYVPHAHSQAQEWAGHMNHLTGHHMMDAGTL